MPDYRKMFDADYIGAWDLQDPTGRLIDVSLTINKVEAGTISGTSGRKSKKPVLHFRATPKGLVVNKTNGKIIARLYGNNTDQWIGKRITLYATTTTFGADTVECIRVRPERPADSPRRTNGHVEPASAIVEPTPHAPAQPIEPNEEDFDDALEPNASAVDAARLAAIDAGH